jgi:hypothetical protein
VLANGWPRTMDDHDLGALREIVALCERKEIFVAE